MLEKSTAWHHGKVVMYGVLWQFQADCAHNFVAHSSSFVLRFYRFKFYAYLCGHFFLFLYFSCFSRVCSFIGAVVSDYFIYLFFLITTQSVRILFSFFFFIMHMFPGNWQHTAFQIFIAHESLLSIAHIFFTQMKISSACISKDVRWFFNIRKTLFPLVSFSTAQEKTNEGWIVQIG